MVASAGMNSDTSSDNLIYTFVFAGALAGNPSGWEHQPCTGTALLVVALMRMSSNPLLHNLIHAFGVCRGAGRQSLWGGTAASHKTGISMVAFAGMNSGTSSQKLINAFVFAGALAGNPFGVDRQFIAQELGFYGGVCPNSMDAVSDRDFVVETLFFTALHLTHLSRWAEDLIIYSSGAFKYVQCSDAYATGLLPPQTNF